MIIQIGRWEAVRSNNGWGVELHKADCSWIRFRLTAWGKIKSIVSGGNVGQDPRIIFAAVKETVLDSRGNVGMLGKGHAHSVARKTLCERIAALLNERQIGLEG